MIYYIVGVFVLFFLLDVYYFLRLVVTFAVSALIRPKAPGVISSHKITFTTPVGQYRVGCAKRPKKCRKMEKSKHYLYYLNKRIWDVCSMILHFLSYGDQLISNAMVAVSATFNVYTVCWPNHIDPYLHMNNSRFLREMDFGRYDFYLRTGRVVEFLLRIYKFLENEELSCTWYYVRVNPSYSS